MLEISQKSGRPDQIRRIFDVGIALLALTLFSPIILLICCTILIESGGPILFSQARLGRHGRPFRILKFRKFRQKCDSPGLPLTLNNDPRMSAVGRILARTKLDELPQFINVLRGEMAIVGPRPESLDFVDCFTSVNRQVLRHLPGIFGPSQSAFRNECAFYPDNSDPASFYRKVLFPIKMSIDLAYYPHRSLLSDLKWVLTGVLAVLDLHAPSIGPSAPIRTSAYRIRGADKRQRLKWHG